MVTALAAGLTGAWLAHATPIQARDAAAASALPVEAQVEASGPDAPLRGTMLSPSPAAGRKAPVVLIIPGSGPTDRDGNSALGVRAAPLARLAQGLAEHGIVTVRIDKRGLFGSAGAIAGPNAVTIGDYAGDVHAWAASIRQRTGARCVWVLGHSEGGLVALKAGQDGRGLCGLILVATPGRPMGAILREQMLANPANAPLLDQAFAAIAALEGGRHVEADVLHPALRPLFSPSVQDFLIDEMAQDPARLAATAQGPILILQGERDVQVSVKDARLLKAARPDAELALLPDTNHVLKTVTSDDRAANVATYADPGLPLAPAVVPAVARFVQSHR